VQPLDEIVVFGRAAEQIGNANSASEGLVGYADLRIAPMLRVGELVEAVPGMVATQHSGTGKANQYFLRGFNLDHGTDFSATAEGIPLNMRTHGHGHGYLDLNFLIPELVATSRYRKGPYSARVGDFSSAGSVDFAYYDRLEEALIGATLGGFDYYRGLAAGSLDAGSGALTAAIDVTRYGGPWALDEDLRQNKRPPAQSETDTRLPLQRQAGELYQLGSRLSFERCPGSDHYRRPAHGSAGRSRRRARSLGRRGGRAAI
jgi:hypothetical protein